MRRVLPHKNWQPQNKIKVAILHVDDIWLALCDHLTFQMRKVLVTWNQITRCSLLGMWMDGHEITFFAASGIWLLPVCKYWKQWKAWEIHVLFMCNEVTGSCVWQRTLSLALFPLSHIGGHEGLRKGYSAYHCVWVWCQASTHKFTWN